MSVIFVNNLNASPPFLSLQLKRNPNPLFRFSKPPPTLNLRHQPSLKPLFTRVKIPSTSPSHSLSRTFQCLDSLKPHLLSQRRPILLGWVCSPPLPPPADSPRLALQPRQTIVPGTLQLSAMVAQMLAISPVLSLISAMVIPCMALVIAYLGEELRKISNQANLSVAALSAYLNEIFPAFLFLKANYGEGIENARFEKLARTDLSERLRKKKMKVLIPQIVQIMYFGALFLFCVGSLAISRGSFDGRGMISFITSLVFLIEPIQGIGKAYNEFKQGEPAIVRLFDLIQFKAKVMEKPNAFHVNHVRGEVQFCDISFKYGDNLPLVLNGLNLHIKAGETVALVGPSGGGKTTLAKLLLRLYDPLSGYILIDNHNIQSIRLQSLRRHVGLVSQDIIIRTTFYLLGRRRWRLRFLAKRQRRRLKLVGINSSLSFEPSSEGGVNQNWPEMENRRWWLAAFPVTSRRRFGQRRAAKMVRFSLSLHFESIGTEITSIGYRTEEISRSEVSIVFGTLVGDCGFIRRSLRSCDLSKCSAH
ncbi:ABC transporter B family member 29 [Morus notabilis]|uniref:ABC transporter B family member 29 n=1 Tax=Morus notabilis TaxID=981085 RepID=W9QUL7_9ROSA|nr:ABC transporter B family member 29 [Morus notabilis]